MEAAKSNDVDLGWFEDQLENQLRYFSPDSLFVSDLKQRLVSSKVFERRTEIGAIVVVSLAVMLAGALTFILGRTIQEAKKKIIL